MPLPATLFAEFTSPACRSIEAALRDLAERGSIVVHRRAASADGPGKAHEAAKLAREQGVEEQMRVAIYRAFHQDGLDIGRIDVLQRLGSEVGLDPFDIKVALDIDRFRDEVLRDREVARRLGIREIPVLYLGTGPRARILIGPQSPEELEKAIASYEPT